MRILLVEDEPDAARMVAKGLREEAYAVDVAGDGESACYQAAIADYDAIVLDVLLPGRTASRSAAACARGRVGPDPDADGARRGRGAHRRASTAAPTIT